MMVGDFDSSMLCKHIHMVSVYHSEFSFENIWSFQSDDLVFTNLPPKNCLFILICLHVY